MVNLQPDSPGGRRPPGLALIARAGRQLRLASSSGPTHASFASRTQVIPRNCPLLFLVPLYLRGKGYKRGKEFYCAEPDWSPLLPDWLDLTPHAAANPALTVFKTGWARSSSRFCTFQREPVS